MKGVLPHRRAHRALPAPPGALLYLQTGAPLLGLDGSALRGSLQLLLKEGQAMTIASVWEAFVWTMALLVGMIWKVLKWTVEIIGVVLGALFDS